MPRGGAAGRVGALRRVVLRGRHVPWLALVALAYAAVQLAVAVPHAGLGWDETVYVSQVDPHNPAAYFSAPRSRGISLLVAPVLAVTGSTLALRVVLALLSAACLYAAFRVWRPLLGRRRTALAALLFAGLWVTMLYGPQAMPNLWVALSAVAAVGWFLRGTGGMTGGMTGMTRAAIAASPRAWLGLAATVASATLFRFSDGVWLALPLLVACVTVRAWRRAAPVLAIAAGAAIGAAEWIVEAYVRWGGVGARLHVSSATEGGMGAHWAGGFAWRSLNGPLLCRPCHVPLTHPGLTLWWLALPVVAVAACAVALRSGRTPLRDAAGNAPAERPSLTLLPVACAAALSVPYLFLIDYSAPRFFLPVYALLSLPAATLASRTVGACGSARTRAAAGALLAALLAVHLAGQLGVLQYKAADVRVTAGRYRAAADALRDLGLRPPCLVTGKRALPIAYYAHCASAETAGRNRSTTARALLRRAAHEPTAALRKAHRGPPYYARDWTPHHLPGTHWTVYVR